MVTNRMGPESLMVVWAVEMASVPTNTWRIVHNGPQVLWMWGLQELEWSGCTDTMIMACEGAMMDR